MYQLYQFLYILMFIALVILNILIDERIKHWENASKYHFNYGDNDFEKGQLYEKAKANKKKWRLIQTLFNLIFLPTMFFVWFFPDFF